MNSEISNVSLPQKRSLLDIELLCKDGSIRGSSHLLGLNSVVFDRMLFSETAMLESKSNIVHLDDIYMADMDLMLSICKNTANAANLTAELSEDRVFEYLRLAHRFEFLISLSALCTRLLQLITVPNAIQLQFADRLELTVVLEKWSLNCKSMLYYHQFVNQLVEYPMSATTVGLFSNKHLEAMHTLILTCMLLLNLVNINKLIPSCGLRFYHMYFMFACTRVLCS